MRYVALLYSFCVALWIAQPVAEAQSTSSTSIAFQFPGKDQIDDSGTLFVEARDGSNPGNNLVIDNLVSGHVATKQILQDFPGAQEAQVWDVGISKAHVILSLILEYRNPDGSVARFDSILARYGEDASLKSVYEMQPAQCFRVAVTPNEDVYCYGPTAPPNDKANFFALRKYSADGKLVGRYLNDQQLKGLFPLNPRDIADNAQWMQANEKGVCAIYFEKYAALLIVDTANGSVKKVDLSGLFKKLGRASSRKSSFSAVHTLSVGDRSIALELTLLDANMKLRHDIMVLALDGTSILDWRTLPAKAPTLMSLKQDVACFPITKQDGKLYLTSQPLVLFDETPDSERAGIAGAIPFE